MEASSIGCGAKYVRERVPLNQIWIVIKRFDTIYPRVFWSDAELVTIKLFGERFDAHISLPMFRSYAYAIHRQCNNLKETCAAISAPSDRA
jgi:hypothetical protein